MILVGNQRGGGKNLALHLTKDENEHVHVHQIRGFASNDLESAFQESHAMSRATKCKQHLFSLSLNPPRDAETSPELFEDTADRAEERLGLTGQPRAIVFHTKNGRMHAHAVWCRVEPEEMKAVPLPYTKRKMQDLSRELYREHGWTMPRGFERTEFRDPRNYSLAEWQQAKRAEKDPAKLKAMFQDTWAMSDSKLAFENALRERGYHLARGDRRGHVAVDFKGEVYPISRWSGVKAKDVRARLGDLDDLLSVQQAQQDGKDVIAKRLDELQREEQQRQRVKTERLERERFEQAQAQREHREKLKSEQAERQSQERAQRNARLRKGFAGILDRLTGRRKKTLSQNAHEVAAAKERDQTQHQTVLQAQKKSREEVAAREKKMSDEFASVQRKLAEDVAALRQDKAIDQEREAYKRNQREAANHATRRKARDGPSQSR